MAQNMGFGMPIYIRDAGGTVIFTGAVQVGCFYHAKNTGAAVINAGEGVIFDPVNAVLPRWDLVFATDTRPTEVTAVKQLPSAASVGLIGVALNKIPINATDIVAGAGSILCAASIATLRAAGDAAVGGSGTAGKLTTANAPTIGQVLGECIQINQVASPGTGSTGMIGVVIAPR